MEIFCISLSWTIKVNLSHEDLEARNSLWSGPDPSGSLGCDTKHEHKTFTLSMETSISALKCGNSSTFATFQLSYFPASQPGVYRKQIWAVIRIISTGISAGFRRSAGISKHCCRGAGGPCPEGCVTPQMEQQMPVPSDNPNPLVPLEGHWGHNG